MPENRTKAQTAFQDAVKSVFGKTQADKARRAKLRDHLAEEVLPEWLATELRNNSQQFDGAEFTTYLLDHIVPEENKFEETSEVKWQGGTSQRQESQTKLELPLRREVGSKNTGAIKCSEMLNVYCETDDLKGDNQYEDSTGRKVDATRRLIPKVKNSNADVVVSLRRHAAEITGYEKKADGTTRPVSKQVRINDPVDLDIIEFQDLEEKKQKYEATSFIVHRGSMNGGHYVTYVKEQSTENPNDAIWVCYNDSTRTELSEELPREAAQAYTIKLSPLADASKDGVSRYKTKLPTSQGCGTENGGVRCWANAAFAFALSITSLHENGYEKTTALDSDIPRVVNEATIEQGSATDNLKLLDLDKDETPFSEFLEEFQRIEKLEKQEITTIDLTLEEIGCATRQTMLQNAANRYLIGLANEVRDEKATDILNLIGFFSAEENIETTAKIVEEIEKNATEFNKNPQKFCSQIITSDSTAKKNGKTLKQTESPQFTTIQDLCYAAIDSSNEDHLRTTLPYAIKQDKDFLTDALCYATFGSNDKIKEVLINDFKADPKKKSQLYDTTAEEIEKSLALEISTASTQTLSLEEVTNSQGSNPTTPEVNKIATSPHSDGSFNMADFYPSEKSFEGRPPLNPNTSKAATAKSLVPANAPAPTGALTLGQIIKVNATKGVWAKAVGGDRQNNFVISQNSSLNTQKDAEAKMAEILIGLMSKEKVKSKNGGKDLTKEQLLKIIEVAQNKGGISNKKNLESDNPLYKTQSEKELSDAGINPTLAKFISAKYQQACKEAGIISGRKGPNEEIGSRLTFLPDSALEIVNKNLENPLIEELKTREKFKNKINSGNGHSTGRR
ncbi:MAG: ubiquitin carboxyl-terminal hydrolase [Rickettsiales bacterium]|nr:ubiquitin carboxyl-terminal hydrolase [Rickettsiales bacterium]